MRNIKNNFALKAFGSVAFVISASITVVSVVAIIYAMIYGCYNAGGFFSSPLCRDYAYSRAWESSVSYIENGSFPLNNDSGVYVKIYDRGYPDGYDTYTYEERSWNSASENAAENTTEIVEPLTGTNESSSVTNVGDFNTDKYDTNIPQQYSNSTPLLEGSFSYTSDNGRFYEVVYGIFSIPENSWLSQQKEMYESFNSNKYNVIAAAVIFAIIAFALYVYLLAAAGHVRKKGVEGYEDVIQTNLHDKIPFDLYLVFDFIAACCVVVAIEEVIYMDLLARYQWIAVIVSAVIGSTLFLSTSVTLATRIKTKTLIKTTVCYKCADIFFAFIRLCLKGAGSFINSLPYTWGAVLFVVVIIFVNATDMFLFNFIVDVAVILIAYKFAKTCVSLERAGKEIADGNMNYRVDTKRMRWRFKKHGENLNSINRGIALAVEKQMKSERMKTELITNVSHDIKTPLTSIINYVGLLKGQCTPEQQKEYIDVLSRQSDRLKKLIDDLLEASKASTGNINVDIKELLASEIIYQSEGEYDEKLKNANLTVVVTTPENEKPVKADGRLLWRVMDNLFSNVCKYAQNGTRVYVDLKQEKGETVISVKNISKDQLNINADELMERFVRGDASRNTEGSGLGLNIAKSLVELQGGKFGITIDGDLFKAEIRLN